MSLDAAQMSLSKYETNMMLKQTGLSLTSIHLCVALRKMLVGAGGKISTVAISSSFWGTIPYNPYPDPKSMSNDEPYGCYDGFRAIILHTVGV